MNNEKNRFEKGTIMKHKIREHSVLGSSRALALIPFGLLLLFGFSTSAWAQTEPPPAPPPEPGMDSGGSSSLVQRVEKTKSQEKSKSDSLPWWFPDVEKLRREAESEMGGYGRGDDDWGRGWGRGWMGRGPRGRGRGRAGGWGRGGYGYGGGHGMGRGGGRGRGYYGYGGGRGYGPGRGMGASRGGRRKEWLNRYGRRGMGPDKGRGLGPGGGKGCARGRDRQRGRRSVDDSNGPARGRGRGYYGYGRGRGYGPGRGMGAGRGVGRRKEWLNRYGRRGMGPDRGRGLGPGGGEGCPEGRGRQGASGAYKRFGSPAVPRGLAWMSEDRMKNDLNLDEKQVDSIMKIRRKGMNDITKKIAELSKMKNDIRTEWAADKPRLKHIDAIKKNMEKGYEQLYEMRVDLHRKLFAELEPSQRKMFMAPR